MDVLLQRILGHQEVSLIVESTNGEMPHGCMLAQTTEKLESREAVDRSSGGRDTNALVARAVWRVQRGTKKAKGECFFWVLNWDISFESAENFWENRPTKRMSLTRSRQVKPVSREANAFGCGVSERQACRTGSRVGQTIRGEVLLLLLFFLRHKHILLMLGH